MKTIIFLAIFLPATCKTYCTHDFIGCGQNGCSNLMDNNIRVTTFLDWMISDTIPLYVDPGGNIQVSLLCTNSNTDDVIMMDIISVNDSMYQVSVFSGESDSTIGIGWVYKNAPIRVMGKEYSTADTLCIFDGPNSRNAIQSLTKSQLSATGILNVVDACVENGWIKIRVIDGTNVAEGWIPPKSYCGNPYTTCG